MKAIEMPINIIVIVLIVALVALGIISFFVTGWRPSSEVIQRNTIKNAACLQWNCGITDILPEDIDVSLDVGITGDDTDNNLENLCKDHYNADCKKTCNC